MSTRARKWLIFGIIVAVLAAVFGVTRIIHFQKYKIPDDAVLGNLDISMVQAKPETILSMFTDETTTSTTLYAFRPDGGMSIASLDLDGCGGYYIPQPGNVYFIKGNKLYCCSVVNKSWKVTDRKTWQAFAIFELRNGIPYIDDNYKVNDTVYPLIQHEEYVTWANLISQVQQKISEYKNSR